MSREEAIQFVSELEDAVNSHDTRRLLMFYAEEAITVSPVFAGLVGRAAIAASWETIFSRFPDWTVKVSDVLVDGDRVAFLGTAGGTDRNGWFGQSPTGSRVEYRAAIVLTVVEGKIVRDERLYDLSGVLQTLENARLDKELKMAAEVQQALLSGAKQLTSYCESVGDSIPCRAIGGDFFELVDLPDRRLGIALGDVSGKGPASAILASMIQGMLAVQFQTECAPSAILTSLNRLLVNRGLQPRFATLVYGVLSSDGRFVYSNAGHNPPLVLGRDGAVRRLVTGGPILGVFGASNFEEQAVDLHGGDTLIMFSDGVTEARDLQDQEFGEDRLIKCAVASGMNSASDVLQGILSGVQDFCQGAAHTDDITVTVTQFRP